MTAQKNRRILKNLRGFFSEYIKKRFCKELKRNERAGVERDENVR